MQSKVITHKFLGKVEITEECLALQALSTDLSTVYVEYDGDIREVSKSLILELKDEENV